MTTVPPLSPGGQSQSFTATSDFSSLVELLSGPLASTSSSSLSNTKLPDLQYTLTSAYLSHLTTLPLPSLLSEPTSLASTSSQLTNALTTLCTSSYPTFLSLHTSTSSLHSSLDTFSTSLSTLLDTLPALESSSQSFSTKIKHVRSERQKRPSSSTSPQNSTTSWSSPSSPRPASGTASTPRLSISTSTRPPSRRSSRTLVWWRM